MTATNATPIDIDKGLFSVLGFLTADISSPYWTHVEDISEPGAIGATFSFMPEEDKDGDHIPADFSVIDVTDDPGEPNISTLTTEDAAEFDAFLREEAEEGLPAIGAMLVEWMNSHLNTSADAKALMTAYKGRMDGGKHRQYVCARRRFLQRNVLMLGSFDVERADEFLPRIMEMMARVRAVTYSS